MNETDILEELKRVNSGIDLIVSSIKLSNIYLRNIENSLKELGNLSDRLNQLDRYHDEVVFVMSKMAGELDARKAQRLKELEVINKLNKYLEDWV
jgi:hypothetical protein